MPMQKKMKTKIASIIMLCLILMFTIVNPLSIFAESENVESEPANGELQVTTDDGFTPIIVEETDDNNDQINEETTVTEEKQDFAEQSVKDESASAINEKTAVTEEKQDSAVQNTKDESASAIKEETTSLDEKTTAEADKKNEEIAKKETITKSTSAIQTSEYHIPTKKLYINIISDIWNGQMPDSVTVNILANGEKINKKVELNDANEWYEVVDVDMYDENGSLITYSIEPEEVLQIPGYYTGVSRFCNDVNGFSIHTKNYFNIRSAYCENEYHEIVISEIPSKSITVTKNWEGINKIPLQ